jgi:hypothetical protein
VEPEIVEPEIVEPSLYALGSRGWTTSVAVAVVGSAPVRSSGARSYRNSARCPTFLHPTPSRFRDDRWGRPATLANMLKGPSEVHSPALHVLLRSQAVATSHWTCAVEVEWCE